MIPHQVISAAKIIGLIGLFSASLVSAQPLHVFRNGEVADADKINENFSALRARAAQLEADLNARTEQLSRVLGARCPNGSFITGFTSDGTLICNEVTVTPPSPPLSCSNADASPAFITLNDNCEAVVSGTIDQDYTFVSSVQYRLDGPVLVGAGNVNITSADEVRAIKDAGVTLTIEPGTDIRAFDDGTLYVTRGSKLVAEGTPAEPITFSSLDAGYDGLGEWGGVIIAGSLR